jgi:hypothetical protein
MSPCDKRGHMNGVCNAFDNIGGLRHFPEDCTYGCKDGGYTCVVCLEYVEPTRPAW